LRYEGTFHDSLPDRSQVKFGNGMNKGIDAQKTSSEQKTPTGTGVIPVRCFGEIM
jgi:hypothetical protein